MDTMDPVESNENNWEVYRDALLPSKTFIKPRPWERAPVPAHAPRLQGQKIWKKPAIRQQADDASQQELEMGGVGSRKRARKGGNEVLGEGRFANGKENSGPQGLFVDKDVEELLGGRTRGRKRTNTDRVVSPRKPLETVHNAVQLVLGVDGEQEKKVEPPRRRKSLRRTLRRSNLPQISTSENENSLEPIMEVQSEISTAAKLDELDSLCVAIEEEHNDLTSISETMLADTYQVSIGAASIISKEKSQQDSTSPDDYDEIQKPRQDVAEFFNDQKAQKSDATEVKFGMQGATGGKEAPHVPLMNVTEAPEFSSEDAEDHKHPASDLINQRLALGTPTSVFRMLSKDHEPCVEHVVSEARASTVIVQHNIEEISDLFSDVPNETQIASMESVRELESMKSPRKSAGTPKQRKVLGMTQGIRRSTRNRASSAVIEEQLTIEVASNEDEVPRFQNNLVFNKIATGTADQAQEEAQQLSKDTIEAVDNSTRNQLDMFAAVIDESKQPAMDEGHEPALVAEFDTKSILVARCPPAGSVYLPQPSHDVVSGRKEVTNVALPLESISRSNQTSSLNHFTNSQPNVEQSPVDALSDDGSVEASSPSRFSPIRTEGRSVLSEDQVEDIEGFEPTMRLMGEDVLTVNNVDETSDDVPDTFVPDSTLNKLVETISENAQPTTTYDHDDTDMLRNFLTRVKANKEAKAQQAAPKRKRSLPHSPLQLPLGAVTNVPPSSPIDKDEFDLNLPTTSPSNKRKTQTPETPSNVADDEAPKSFRRSGRTRLPVSTNSSSAPSFIPVRRLGQEGDVTVTLKRSEEKELAAITRKNTNKNKAGALDVPTHLKKRAQEQQDPVARQRQLKTAFDAKSAKGKGTEKEGTGKNVAWAKEIAQFQDAVVMVEETPVEEPKKSKVKVGSRSSRIALGMGINGTPAPKRRTREKA